MPPLLGTERRDPPCRECHDETRHPTDLQRPALKGAYHRQCINCHLDWSHENACGFCHEEVKDPARAGPAAVDKTDIVRVRHPLITAPPTYAYETSYQDGPPVTFHHEDHLDAFEQDENGIFPGRETPPPAPSDMAGPEQGASEPEG